MSLIEAGLFRCTKDPECAEWLRGVFHKPEILLGAADKQPTSSRQDDCGIVRREGNSAPQPERN